MAKRTVKRKGRSVVALALLGFVLVATSVIWRRIYGIEQSAELTQLRRERTELEAQKLRLEGEIRDAASRARIAPLAERRLGMKVPNDSQVILLPRPTPGDTTTR